MKQNGKVAANIFALCMAIMMCFIFAPGVVTVQADSDLETVFMEPYGTFSSEGSAYHFSTTESEDFYLFLNVWSSGIDVDLSLKSTDASDAGSLFTPVTDTITGDLWKFDEENNYYWYVMGYKDLPAGDYEMTISSASQEAYYVVAKVGETDDTDTIVSLSSTSISLYAGESKTLSISGTDSAVTWSSSNTSVATVSSGKVTAKKQGTATITAKVDEQELTCSVTVKKPVLSAKSSTITAGQKQTLKVTKNAGKVTWSSNKKSVAIVSGKGVVTAKKAGTATITASVDGCKLTCKVKVVKNQYSRSSASNSQAGYGVFLNTTKISYDKKGQLVCKIQVINNFAHNVEGLQNFKFTVKAKNGSTIASYTAGKKSIYISSGSSKTVTITIPKSKVKKKNADLVNATPKPGGKFLYRY